MFNDNNFFDHYRELILAVVATVAAPEYRMELETYLQTGSQPECGAVLTAIRRILNGERAEDGLYEALNEEESLIVRLILSGIEDPTILRELLLEQPEYARRFRLRRRKQQQGTPSPP
jgi:hypothetical protein